MSNVDYTSSPDARRRVLAKIRAALNASKNDKTREQVVAERLAAKKRNLIPDLAGGDRSEQFDTFQKALSGQDAQVIRLQKIEEVLPTLLEVLESDNLPKTIQTGKDPGIDALGWQHMPELRRLVGAADPDEPCALSHAFAAAAETGTLFLLSGPENPTSLNFLPEIHIVLIKEEQIFASYEDVWDEIRAHTGHDMLPRTVNMISGPSRTADIEQTITKGAHGPKQLVVLVLSTTPDN